MSLVVYTALVLLFHTKTHIFNVNFNQKVNVVWQQKSELLYGNYGDYCGYSILNDTHKYAEWI